jgi:peptide/nickel transport system permease protein
MSLFIAVASAVLGTVLGQAIGLVSGYLGGWVDVFMMRVVDLFFAIPTLLVAIGIVALFGASATTTILALGIAYTPFYARLIRGAVVGVRSRTYVDASRVLGSGGLRLLRADILPGVFPLALVQSTALLGYALVDEASLGFLGLGVQPPDASWGAMINAGRQFIFQAPWLTIIPGAIVIVAVFAINLTGDGLRDIVDPRTSQRATQQQ